ncbi:MAG: DUF2924 domain-containing protein [Planctomycetes bacterium]|nr:DUF2924 domain-containing protein [Planctomycetota bacterium]
MRRHAIHAGWTGLQIVRAVAGEKQALPSLDFVAEAEQCPVCGGGLQVLKSSKRQIATLAHGPMECREIRKQCAANDCPPLHSDALTHLVKSGQKYGYDIVVQVGLLRYLSGLQREEIRHVLRNEYGIELSAGSVSALCDRFLVYFEALHVTRAPSLREALGEYPLHLDGTNDRGKGGLFVCIDGWRNWVLWAARIPTERTENLTPVIDKTVQLFGPPVATVRDMGAGVASAVESLRKTGIPDLVCHYHFLAAVGRSLFKTLYDKLRDMIRQTGCRAEMRVLLRDLRMYSSLSRKKGRFGLGLVRDDLKALVLWVLEGDGRVDAPFPFALPHLDFAKRCGQVDERKEQWIRRPRGAAEKRAIDCLQGFVALLENTPRFIATVNELEARWTAFCELRDVLRLSKAELPRGDTRTMQTQLPALEMHRLQQIKQAVEQYTGDIEGRITAKKKRSKRSKSAAGIIIGYLQQYYPFLFGHPVKLDENGIIVAITQRTNNVAEHFFGREKQQLRRRVGRGQLGRDLEDQPAQVALVSNLKNPEYVRCLVGSVDKLPDAFAQLDQETSTDLKPLNRENRNSQILRVLRKMLEESAAHDEEKQIPKTIPSVSLTEDITASEQEMETLLDEDSRAQKTVSPPKPRDPRLPPAGTMLVRWYKGRAYRIEILENSFRWRGRTYMMLSDLVQAIVKSPRDCYVFLGLTIPWPQSELKISGRRLNRTTMIDLPPTTEF